ncbi:MAG: hypothetical protein FJ333_00835 [Sphingomonadales bacterium]|nr:hypothetical protein [Sphingomonadales bacterium]
MPLKIDPQAIVQTVDINDDDLKFKSPFAMCISGQSMSGKSEFILKLISHRQQMFDTEFQQILYCEPESLALRHNPIFEKLQKILPSIRHVTGLPDVQKLNLNLDKSHKLLIIDDLMEPFLHSPDMVSLLSAEVHRFNINTIFTLQNFFAQSKHSTTISRNVTYRVIFYNRLDLTEIRTISTKISQQPRFLLDSFEFLKREFPEEPAYIVLDGHILSPIPGLHVRSQIFPSPQMTPIFFFPKQYKEDSSSSVL